VSGAAPAVAARARKGADRTRDVARAALACFSHGGYRLTQIAHVAERMNVSVGTIYRYVESKEALFHIAALEAAGELPDDMDLPVTVSGLDETIAAIGAMAAREPLWPVLRVAVERPPPPDVKAEARAIADELYATISARAAVISLLDGCAQEIPRLADIFNRQIRHRLMGDLMTWALSRDLVPGGRKADAEALTRGAMEAIAWLAKTRQNDPTAAAIGEPQARAAAVRIFTNAFDYGDGDSPPPN
jgi:AcrR family transcriptional regulator